MDAIVVQAMAKWPNVPDCFGWLGLDQRGRWYMRDDRTQAAGPFPQSRGSWLQHEGLLRFIERNYGCDAHGRWYFQNGPQRVFVELECTPWIWRLLPDGAVRTHTGAPAQPRQAWMDEAGRLYLLCDLGFGLVHSADMSLAADMVEAGRWDPQTCHSPSLPKRFGYVLQPSAQADAAPHRGEVGRGP